MKPGLTEIVCVVDRSGSMDIIRKDAIGSFNQFLTSQKEVPGEAKLSLTLFNTEYEMPYKGAALNDVQPFTEETYRPGGCTALLDAVGKTIDEVGERFHKTPEADRPERVLFVVLTDGQENSSREYNRKQILDKIAHQRDVCKWEFVFLVAGQEAMAEAGKLGISLQNTYAYKSGDAAALKCAVHTLSSNVRSYRGGAQSVDWSNRENQ